MKNITISLDKDLARWARIKAAEQDKSLSRFVADLLQEQAKQESDDEAARQRFLETLRSVKPVRLRRPGEKLPTREELYDRKLFRR